MRPTVKLWEICDILDKKRKPITQKDRTKWIYPYYWASWVLDYVADYIFDEDLVLIWEDWAKWGALDNSAFKVSWKVWVNNHAHVIRPHREKILDDFLVYFLVSSDLSDYITWTTVPKLNQERLKLIEIPLPPLETQKAIVARLDQTKSEIQKNLDNTDELWKSALNQAFQGDWEMKTIEELTTSIEYWIWETWLDKWDLRYVRITDIDEDCLLKDYDKKYIMLNEKSKLSLLKKWDVLIARIWATFGKCLYFDSDELSAFAWYLIRPNFKKEVNTKYFSLFAQSWLYWNQANNLVSWWWQPQFNANAIKKIKFIVPPLSEQEKIVEHLDQVSKEVKTLKSQYQSQLDNLEELKKSVLDKAFRWE